MALLYSQEEMVNSKPYQLLFNVTIQLPFKKEAAHQRHQMSMEILDHMHQKDAINFQIVAEEIAKWWKKKLNDRNLPFPEEIFRQKFGSHAPQASWFHIAERMKFQIMELNPNMPFPDTTEYYVEFLKFLSKKSGWFQYINGDADFIPSNDARSWVKPSSPKPDFQGNQIYYNAEVFPNTPNWFNYNKPLELNPQTGIIANELPLYVLDIDHSLKLDEVACIHVRMTSYANDNKYTMINTDLDATNRIDQDVSAPMVFSIDEFTDCADQKHTFPITAHSTAFGGVQPKKVDSTLEEEEKFTLEGNYVDILGKKTSRYDKLKI